MSFDAEIALPPADETDGSPAPAAPAAAARRLRFLVCGSVDDGKSTLIGRLLWDTKSVAEDHRSALVARGSRQNDLSLPDFGLLLDGLRAEQEQGITIDVAYRYFQTPRRAFIVADTPGHAQYTRNMATGASTADLAVLLVDARAGLLEQTRRHAAIVHLMGIRNVILAVNKIDLVGYDSAAFHRIENAFRAYVDRFAGMRVSAIPVSALKGENVAESGRASMPWYGGPTLLEALETADEAQAATSAGFRMPVQRVCRPDESFRGYQGTVAAGSVGLGDRVTVNPSGETVTVTRIVTFDGDLPRAESGDAVTLVLDRPVDVARGDILSSPDDRPVAAKGFAATVVALQPEGLTDGAEVLLKAAGRYLRARIAVDSAYDLASGQWLKGSVLPLNAIGRVRLSFRDRTVFDRFADCRDTGAFVLVGPQSNTTIAGGMILDPAEPGARAADRLTLTLPRDLAQALLALPEVRQRMAEVTVADSRD